MAKSKRMKEFQERIQKNKESMEDDIYGFKKVGNEKLQKCEEFFAALTDILKDHFEAVGSCNKDVSQYLVPIGTSDQITYYGKPENSFRVSDHWNWYTSIKKCSDSKMIQCYSKDLPFAKQREGEGLSSRPIRACMVAVYLNGTYHHVYGEKFDRKTKTWNWTENSPEEAVQAIFNER